DGPQAQAAAEAERQRMTQLAARLRASEENQRRVLDASGAGLWELHFASGSIAADERMVELMGLPPGSSFTLASSLTGHVLPADRERVGVAVRAAMAGENDGHYFVEFRTGGHGGAPLRWVESRARVTFDARGQATHLGGAMIDITARRVAEEAQRTSDERYRTLFNSIDEGFCLIEVLGGAPGQPLDYRFLEVNHAFEQQTGLEDAEGRTMRELNPRHEEHWFEIYARVAATGEAVRFVNEASALGRWFDVHASRLGSVEKRQVAVLFKDITAQQLAAQERERLLARESEARREAEEANRLKDEFLATVSHELRTGALPADHRRTALETIERNARAQAQLVEDLLDMSRILSGRLRLELE
ncbi:MAG: PAS domain S-box protein, partial [Myxococcales bacterium]